jgi:hypothetical protein
MNAMKQRGRDDPQPECYLPPRQLKVGVSEHQLIGQGCLASAARTALRS